MKYFKAGIFLVACFLTFGSFALPSLEISQLEGSFKGSDGTGRAKLFRLENDPAIKDMSFKIIKESDQFRLQTSQREYLWEGAPEFLLELDEALWRGVSGESEREKLSLKVNLLEGENQDDGLRLSQLVANCQGISESKDFLFQLLGVCSQKGSLSFEDLTLMDKNPISQTLLKVISRTLKKELRTASKATRLEDLTFSLNKGKFEFRVKADLDLRVTVKGNGHLSFQEHSTGGAELRVRLDRVKASFLTITDRVFDEIEALGLKSVTVQRPFIIVDLP